MTDTSIKSKKKPDTLLENINHQSLLNSLNSGVIVFDHNQIVVAWNDWVAMHSGISAKHAVGKRFAQLFPNMIGKRTHEAIESNIHHGLPAIVSNTLNFSPFPFYVGPDYKQALKQNIYITSLKSDEPGHLCLVNIVDVTAACLREESLEKNVLERKQAEAALIEARRLAEEASNAKTQFLTNISHELRTPMNGILGMTELLRDMHLDKESADYVETLYSSSHALLTLLNDLLDFNKIEAGTFSLVEDSFNLYQLANECLRLLSFKSKQKGLKVEQNIAPECPNHLLGDVGRIRQILINLLDNAIKFTEKGKINLTIDLVDENESSCFLNFTVHDTGIGITPDELPHIFDSFTQIDKGTTRQYSGTGLGLAISKQLTEMMHGELIVDSCIGKGSTFSFMLPLQKDVKAAQEYNEINQNIKPLSGHILLVENEVANQKVAKAMLKRLGLTIDIAGTGEEAIIKSAMFGYDVILMDLGLPDIDGIHVTWLIKARQKMEGGDTPIIALTACVTEEDRNNCFDAGMCDFIAKPVSLHELQKTLAMWL